MRYAHIVKLKNVRGAPIRVYMLERTANLLGVVGLAVAERIDQNAREILRHSGETPAALVVIGYGFGPSNERLRKVLGLSHPGAVRLVDRLVADGLVERRAGADRRTIALFLTKKGTQAREELLAGRLEAIKPMVSVLDQLDQAAFGDLLHKMLEALNPTDAERCQLCRLCDDRVCVNCPIPADFKQAGVQP